MAAELRNHRSGQKKFTAGTRSFCDFIYLYTATGLRDRARDARVPVSGAFMQPLLFFAP